MDEEEQEPSYDFPPRAAKRFSVLCPVTVRSEAGECTGNTRNISTTGVFMETDTLLPDGTECKISLMVVKGGQPDVITVPGQVIRHDDEGMGLLIYGTDATQTAAIQDLTAGKITPRPTADAPA